MLLRIVAVFTFVSALSGLLRVIMVSRRRSSAPVPDAKLLRKTRRQRRWGWNVFWLSVSAFLFLVTGYATPVEILLALAFALAVFYPLTFIKGGLQLVSGEQGGRALAIARDPATGEEFGLVVGQLREPESDRITGYKIRTKDGELIERTVEAVVVDFQ